jgi:methylmalonyl-CoA mutase cobalamin-binding subunit
MKQKTLLTTIPSDSHSWGLVYLHLLLEEMGHDVINIGTCVPIDVLIEKCHQNKPDNIVISSVNGHGHLDGINMIRAIKQFPLLKNIRVVIGGKLGTQGINNCKYIDKLLHEGFDAVFAENDIATFISFMNDKDTFQHKIAM